MPMHKRFLQRSRAVLPYFLAAMFMFPSCDGDFLGFNCDDDTTAPPQPTAEYIVYNFDTDLDGWSVGTSGKSLDAAVWMASEGGMVKLDGSDFGSFDGEPNSWIYKEITVPSSASKFSFRTCAHNRDGATGSLRVRLADDGGTWHTLLDWEQMTGVEGEYNWINRSADIKRFAGKTVRFYIEQGDDGEGSHEQRYVDTVTIKYKKED